MNKIYVSYAEEDKPLAASLIKVFGSCGFEVLQGDGLTFGDDDYIDVEQSKISTECLFIVLLSPHYASSKYCVDESDYALYLSEKYRLINFIYIAKVGQIEPAQAGFLGNYDWFDLTNANQIDELSELIEALRKGVSVREKTIEIPSYVDRKALEHLKVFLCYSSKDRIFVRMLYQRLQAAGINLWLDEENLYPGQDWDLVIQKEVQQSDAIIVCLSRNSISRKGYVQKEIKLALDESDKQPENAIFIIPVKLEECEIPERLKHLHCVNLFEYAEKGLSKMIMALDMCAKMKSNLDV